MIIRPVDIEMQAFPGGGVLLTHKPSGITAWSCAENDQIKNRELATELLRNELYAKGYTDQY